jgi:hypothetical protein
MRKLLLLLLAACGASLAAPVEAQMQGFFGVGGLAAQTDNAREFAREFGGTSADRSADGMKIYGGYQGRQFGVEAAYYDLGTYDVRAGTAKRDDFSVTAFTVSGMLALPLGPSFYLNGRLGIAFTSANYRCYFACGGDFVDTSESGVTGLIGGGIGWRITRNLSLRADFESIGPVSHAVGLIEAEYDYQLLSVGLQADF